MNIIHTFLQPSDWRDSYHCACIIDVPNTQWDEKYMLWIRHNRKSFSYKSLKQLRKYGSIHIKKIPNELYILKLTVI